MEPIALTFPTNITVIINHSKRKKFTVKSHLINILAVAKTKIGNCLLLWQNVVPGFIVNAVISTGDVEQSWKTNQY